MGNHAVKEESRKSRWTEPWLWRKLAYAVLTVVLLVAVGAGIISPEQSDLWLQNIDKVLGVIAALGFGVAAAKTTPASDVPLSEIEQARADVATAKLTPGMVDDLIAQAKLASLQLQHARDTVAVVEAEAALESSPASETASKPFSVYH